MNWRPSSWCVTTVVTSDKILVNIGDLPGGFGPYDCPMCRVPIIRVQEVRDTPAVWECAEGHRGECAERKRP